MERKLKRCPYCGKEILSVANKCRYCGMWISGDDAHLMRCPSCGERIDKRSKTCPYCSEPISAHESDSPADNGTSPARAEDTVDTVSAAGTTNATSSAGNTAGMVSSAGNADGADTPADTTPASQGGQDENKPTLNMNMIAVVAVLVLLAGSAVWGYFGKGKPQGAAPDTTMVDSDTVSCDDDTATADPSAAESSDQVLELAEQVFKKCYYDRYGDGEDYPTVPFGYQVSPDGKFLFVVTNVMANGSGWMTEDQLQRYNIETGELRFITDCAGIIMDDDGITVAKATATNEETAQSEAELNYRVHDQHYTWNGKADLGGDYVEYGREHFEQEYSAGGYTYVSGVERFPKSFIDASMQ